MRQPPEDVVLRILREEFDGSEKGVERAVRKIGKALRAALPQGPDPRQVVMFEGVHNG